MLNFSNDYSEGAHPRIIKALNDTNMIQTKGYGEDTYCQEAAVTIKKLCKQKEADVHFLVGGTQTNLTVISSILRPHQGVISAETGHINIHETGAIEACGHKVLTVESKDGKLYKSQIKKIYQAHKNDEAKEHTVQPKLVYISNPTEVGTIYSKKELEELREVCDACDFFLFVDGARLGYGLMADDNDVTLEILAEVADVFYIGGTKVGALFGEAVVITRKELQPDFRYFIKQRGGMLAKGRLLGLQFLELFKDGLYFEISKHAVALAMELRSGLKILGYEFYIESNTNQQFVIVSNKILDDLKTKTTYTFQTQVNDEYSCIRLCTSWATKKEDVEALLEVMRQ